MRMVKWNKAFIVDYTNNRVLVYNSIPTSNFVAADVVLNRMHLMKVIITALVLLQARPRMLQVCVAQLPVGQMAKKLYVTDRYNNRIMIWNDINSLTSYKACDVVLGQVGFQAGLMGQVIQSFICHLTLWTDGKKMAIADNGNNRVMIYSYEFARVYLRIFCICTNR